MKSPIAKHVLLLTMTGALIFLAGCGKKSESSSVTIALPDFSALDKKQSSVSESPGALAVQTITSRVMINITGPDISVPIVYIWDVNAYPRDATGAFARPPDTISIEVTRGPSRVIQALAIREMVDTDNEEGSLGSTFYYGDDTRSISDSETPVSLTLTPRGTATAAQGNISGRYFNADGSTPTGKINMYYAPPGKPEMIVDQSQTIFSGFFRVFLPSSLDFSYRVAGSGLALFEKVNVNSIFANSSAVVKIQVPSAYRNNSGGTARVTTRARTHVAGFFGYGNTARSTCYSSVSSALQNLFTSSTVGNTSEVMWNPSSSASSDARVESGGAGNAMGTCPNVTEFGGDHFNVITRNVSHGDSPLGFQGPFREMTDGSGQYLNANHNGTAIRVGWRYLRATLGNSVAGIGVFHRTYESVAAAGTKQWSDAAPCSTLVSKFGFSEVTRVPFGTTAAPIETYDIEGARANNFTNGLSAVVICPYSPNGSYHDYGLVARGSAGSYAPFATKIIATVKSTGHVSSSGDSTKISQTVCTPIAIRTVDANNAPAYRQTSGGITPQVTISLTGPAEFYSNTMCSGIGSKSMNVAMYNPDRTVYVKSDDSPTTYPVSVTDTTGSGTAIAPTMAYLAAIPKATPTNVRPVVASTTIYAHQCYPVDFVRGRYDGAQFVPQSSYGVMNYFASNMSAYPGLGFYSSGMCDDTSPPTGAYYMGDPISTVQMYFKYTGLASSIAINPDGGAYTIEPASLTVTQPGPVVRAAILASQSISAESCVPVRVQLQDSANRPTTYPGGMYQGQLGFMPVPPPSNGLYQDNGCNTGHSGIVNIPAGSSISDVVYMRWTSMTSPTLALVSSTPAYPQTSIVINVGAAQAMYVSARVDGVSHTHMGGYLGIGSQKILGYSSFPVYFRGISPLGNVVTSMSETETNATGVKLEATNGPAICSPITWNGGDGIAICSLPTGVNYALVQFSTGGNDKFQYHTTLPQFFATESGSLFQTALYAHSGQAPLNSCIPLLVSRRSGNSFPTLVHAPHTALLTTIGGVSAFYSDAACSMTTTSAMIPAFSSATVVYMKSTGAGAPMPQADGVSLLDPANGGSPTYGVTALGAATQYSLVMETQSKRFACEPLLISRTDATGGSVTGPATLVTFAQANLGATFYMTGDCSGNNIMAINFSTADRAKLVYVKTTDANSGSISVSDGLGATGSLPMITVLGY